MIRATLIFACLALAAFSAPIPEVPENYEDIPSEYKSLIPAEVAEHLKSITPEEKAILKDVAKGYKDFKSEDDFLNALKEKSPALHEKASKLHQIVKDKVNGLNDEAKAFVKKVIADGRKIHAQYLAGDKPTLDSLKATAKTHIDAYKALSQDAKDSISKEFPILTGFFKNFAMHRDTFTGPPKIANSSALLNKSMSDNSSSVYGNSGSGMSQHNHPLINQRERSFSKGVHSSHSHPNPSAKSRRRQKSANRLNKSSDFSRHENYANGNNGQQQSHGTYGAARGSVDMNKSSGGITLQGNNDYMFPEAPPAVAPKPMNPAARYLASRRDKNTGQGAGDPTNSNKALGGVVSQKENGSVVKSKQVGELLDSTKMDGQHQAGQNGINLNKSFGGFDRQQGDDSKSGDQKSICSKNLNKSFGGFDANGEKINTRYQQRLNKKLKRQQQKASNPDLLQEVTQKEVPAPDASVTPKAPLTVGVPSEDVPKTANPYFPSNGKIGGSQGNGNLLNKSSEPSHLGDHTDDSTQQKSHDSNVPPKCLVDMSKSFGGMTLQGNNGSVFTEVPSTVAPKAMNPAARYLASCRDKNTAQGTSDSTNLNKSLRGTKSNSQHQACQYGKGQGPKNPINLNKSFGGFNDQDGNSGKDHGSKSSKNLNKSFGGYAANGEKVSWQQKQRLDKKLKKQQQMASTPITPQEVTQKEVPTPEVSITSMAALTDSGSVEDASKKVAEDVPVNLNWSLPPGNLYQAFEEDEEVYFNHTIGTIQYLDEVDERYRPDRFKFSVFGTSIPSPGIEDDLDTVPESPAADSSGDPLIVDETIMEWNPVELMKKFNKPEFWKSSLEIEIPTVVGSDQEVKYVGYYNAHRCTLPTMPVLYAKPNICNFLHPETFELMNMPAGFLFNLYPTVPHQEGEFNNDKAKRLFERYHFKQCGSTPEELGVFQGYIFYSSQYMVTSDFAMQESASVEERNEIVDITGYNTSFSNEYNWKRVVEEAADLMIRATLIFACLALAALSAPIPEVPENFDDIPTEYKGLIPAEVAEHLKAITPEEKAALKDLALRHKEFKTEEEFKAALKEKSPSLYEKAGKLEALLTAKFEKLDASAQALVKKIIAKGRELHQQYLAGEKPSLDSLKELAKGYIAEYKALSDDAKATITAEFPILTGFFQNEKVQAIVGQYVN
uniref:Fatty-acid and retinol-binding protein 1 n=1 Tax=Caenorhabditis tropicalis TaxID=1561998 RepID=A0A1I7U5Q7_9PELO